MVCRPEAFRMFAQHLESLQQTESLWRAAAAVSMHSLDHVSLDALDDHDDVQNVYANYEMSDALMEKLSAA